jgi:hypothetical protein
MKRNGDILYIFDADNEACVLFVTALRNALPDWNITMDQGGVGTLLFDLRKYDVAHFFVTGNSKAPKLINQVKGKTKLVQTLLSRPPNAADYSNLVFADHCIVFSEKMKSDLEKQFPGREVNKIPPCIALPDVNLLQPASQVREQFEVEDRIMAVALSDVSSKSQFESFVYVVREFNRRGGFRFLIPSFRKDKQTTNWRSQLQERIDQEKLHATRLLNDDVDFHSILDTSDISLYLDKDPRPTFDVPIEVLEAISFGKPVLCFNVPPLNEVLSDLQPQWISNNVEDIVREAKDIRKQAAQLEQTTTEIARMARNKFGVDQVAAQHRELYERILAEN